MPSSRTGSAAPPAILGVASPDVGFLGSTALVWCLDGASGILAGRTGPCRDGSLARRRGRGRAQMSSP
jgi:hypothetical protein